MGCTICGKPVVARGWCSAHYTKWKRNGDPLANNRPRRSPIEIFTSHMPDEPPPTTSLTEGCWDWTASLQNKGYGRFTYLDERGEKRHMLAHRASHLKFNGPIPPETEILHSCDRPICCQPFHLRADSHSANVQEMWDRNRRSH